MWDAQMKDDDCIWTHLVVQVRISGLVNFVLNANAVDAKHGDRIEK